MIIISLLLVLLTGGSVLAVETSAPQAKPVPVFPTDIEVRQDVTYLASKRKEKADLYLPKKIDGKATGAVIVIHGGGFNDGDKARKREISIGSTLAREGYLAMSINYKLAKVKDKATWPQSVLDAKTAVQWLRVNHAKLGIDPEKIAVLGGSAGGNLAAMLAVTQPKDGFEPTEPYGNVSTTVACAIDLYGAVDLLEYHDMKMFAKTRQEAPELYKAASPTTYVHSGAAPLLLVHGTDDKVVALSQSQTLAEALNRVAAPNELIIIPGAPHSFDLEPSQMDLRPTVFGFLKKHFEKENSVPAPPVR